jgi:hypothetical protein
MAEKSPGRSFSGGLLPARFVLLPKNLMTGAAKARIVSYPTPVTRGRLPLEGEYYLKPRLSRGFFMSAIHRLRNHLVRVVLKTQVPGGH